jgi:hypothetical protein
MSIIINPSNNSTFSMRYNAQKMYINRNHPLRENLRIHLMFNQGGGNDIFDSISGRIGSVLGNPTWTPRTKGQSLYFDGTTDAIRIIDPLEPSEFTYVLWVEMSSAANQSLVTRTDSGGPLGSWAWQLRTDASSKAVVYNFPGGASVGATTLNANQVYCLAITTSAGGQQNVYIDGSLDGGGTGAGLWTGGDRFDIGGNSGGAGPFTGWIHDWRYYTRALTGKELKAIACDPGVDLRRKTSIFGGLGGRIMSSLVNYGGLVSHGGLAGKKGGLAG